MSWITNIVEHIKNSDDFAEIRNFSFKDILSGKIFVTKVVRKRVGWFLLLAFLCFVYIDNDYYCKMQLKRKAKLEEQVQDLKYQLISSETELKTATRRSNIETLLDSAGGLQVSKKPPIMIK